jgi:hypothetical protein
MMHSAEGTIIVQGFDSRVITGGLLGYLRQEFRELELLDEITKLRYKNKLPKHVSGNRRNSIICEFQEWKGTNYVPSTIHNAIRWNKSQPFDKLEDVIVSTWQIIKADMKEIKKLKNKLPNFVPAQGTVSVVVSESTEVLKKSKTSKKQKKSSKSSRNISAEGTAPVTVSVPTQLSKKHKAHELDTETSSDLQEKKPKVSQSDMG